MKNQYNEIFDRKCAVCGDKYLSDIYEQGECKHCGWKNGFLTNEKPDNVIYPNMISLNKAKKLFLEGKPFEPNLDEFLEALYCYGEVQFEYKGEYYALELAGTKDNKTIKLFKFDSRTFQSFKNKEEFKNNAKIENEYLRDIWNKTTDRSWLQ